MEPRITVIVPTWNHRDYLAECLDSLARQTYRAFRTVVVDDGSSEDIIGFVEQEFPDVRVHRLPHNAGFASAVNAGLREVTSEWVFLLNNDMTLADNCIERLAACASETGADMIAPVVLWRDRPETIYSAGDSQRTNGRPESIGFRCSVNDFRAPGEVFGVSAGAALYRREIFERVGLFDERFVAYFEDSDLSFRARLAGYRAACARDAHAYHVGSGSLHGRQWWRARQCFRNHALLVLKNVPLPLLLRHGPAIVFEWLHQTRRVISAARADFGLLRAVRVLLTAAAELATLIPHALRERREVQRMRTIPLRELRALLTK